MKSVTFLVAIGTLFATTACATTYAYHFEPTDNGAQHGLTSDSDTLEDDDVRANVRFAEDAVLLDVTNKTDDVIQIGWSKIALDHGDGTLSTLRPDVDPGWTQAGVDVSARLVPFALPRSGAAAAAYEERHLVLDVPIVVRRHEAKRYQFHFIAHVTAL